MTQEELDFEYFRDNQMSSVDFSTGRIDAYSINRWGGRREHKDVGSLNSDGYERHHCGPRLRMKHRLLFWLYHGYLPIEVDHHDKTRNNNSISNLLGSDRKTNTTGTARGGYKHLTKDKVHALCKDIVLNRKTITQLAADHGRSRAQIKGIMSKKYWSEISDLYF